MIAPTVLVVACSLDELRTMFREEIRAALVERRPASEAASLVDRREMARLLDVAPVTVTRLTAEGMPCMHVGDAPRYDVEVVRVWLAGRARKGTTAAPSKRETINGVRLLSRRSGS